MIVLIIIYVISVIGVVLSIRYDDNGLFSNKSQTVNLVFYPIVNTGIVLIELLILLGCLFDMISHYNLNEKFYKLIRLGREK